MASTSIAMLVRYSALLERKVRISFLFNYRIFILTTATIVLTMGYIEANMINDDNLGSLILI